MKQTYLKFQDHQGLLLAAKIALAFERGQEVEDLAAELNQVLTEGTGECTGAEREAVVLEAYQHLYGACVYGRRDEGRQARFMVLCGSAFQGLPMPDLDGVLALGEKLRAYRGTPDLAEPLVGAYGLLTRLGNEVLACRACRELLNLLMRSARWAEDVDFAQALIGRYEGYPDDVRRESEAVDCDRLLYLPAEV